jgi:hypothetical protein
MGFQAKGYLEWIYTGNAQVEYLPHNLFRRLVNQSML